MTAPAFIGLGSVRDYLALNSSDSTSKYSDATIGSNIRAASWFLQRATGRQFADQTATTKSFTTNGDTLVPLPGLRTATTVTLAGGALTADETYHLVPDVQQSGVYVAIQFRAFESTGLPWWYGKHDWFDRGYDLPFGPANRSSLPNDLDVLGDWGYTAPNLPEPLLHATKVLASYYTLRPNALLSGASATPDGSQFDLSGYPVEVVSFITEWRLGGMVASV